MAQSPSLVATIGIAPPAARTAKGSATRAQLIEATITCLAERGYAGTSTAAICTEAQLTAGALFGHYPNKLALLADTVQSVVDHNLQELSPVVDAAVRAATSAVKKGRASPAGPGIRRPTRLPSDFAAAIDRIPEMFSQPSLQALLELGVAARTEPVLARAFVEDVNRFAGMVVAGDKTASLSREAGRLVAMMLHSLLRFMQGSALTVSSLRAAGDEAAVEWEQQACLIEARRICEFWLGEISERSATS